MCNLDLQSGLKGGNINKLIFRRCSNIGRNILTGIFSSLNLPPASEALVIRLYNYSLSVALPWGICGSDFTFMPSSVDSTSSPM